MRPLVQKPHLRYQGAPAGLGVGVHIKHPIDVCSLKKLVYWMRNEAKLSAGNACGMDSKANSLLEMHSG